MENIKRFITVLRIMLIINFLTIIIFPFFVPFMDEIEVNGALVKEFTPLIICQLIIDYASLIVFFIGLYKLREAMENFYHHQLFNDVISKCFKQIGYLVIIATTAYITLNWLAIIIFTGKIEFHFTFEFLFNGGIALFFFTLSTMIDKAKGIQQENDLTV